MSAVTTEVQFPIRSRWVLKALTPSLLLALVLFGLTSYGGGLTFRTQTFGSAEIGIILATILILSTVAFYLQRAHFHFVLEEKSLMSRWGVFSQHVQEIEYGTIKDVRLKQNGVDRVFGLASLWIMSDQKASWAVSYVWNVRRFRLMDMAGVFGNVAYVPGLDLKDATTLKEILSSRMNG